MRSALGLWILPTPLRSRQTMEGAMSASYGNGSSGPSSPTALYSVTGQYLARANLSRKQRAELAADLADGTAKISPCTVGQAASLVKAPMRDVTRLRCNGKRDSNGHANGGEKPVEPVADGSEPPAPNHQQKTRTPEAV